MLKKNTNSFNSPQFSTATLLHLCRHFSSIPDEEIQNLTEHGFTLEEIKKEISLPGSKFKNPPFSGLNSIKNFIQENWMEREDIFEKDNILTSRWNLLYPPVEIGYDGLVKISNLSDEEKKNIQTRDRKGYSVKTYPTNKLFPTNSFILISKISEINLECITIYPGTYAPPFPDSSMSNEFYVECKSFWEAYALIESI